MIDLTALGAALSGLKTLTDIAKGIQSLKVSAEIREATSNMLDGVLTARTKLIEASETQSALLSRIKELEQQVADFENWNAQKERYQLEAIASSAFAYTMKPGMKDAEPPHWLCTNCFEKRHRGFLQFTGQIEHPARMGMMATWACNTCKSAVRVPSTKNPASIDPAA